MSSDLLGSVRESKPRKGRDKDLQLAVAEPRDLEAGEGGEEDAAPAVESGAMGAFFGEVNTVKGLLEAIRRGLHRLEAANDESKTATKASRIADIRSRMETDVDEVGKKAREAKLRLEGLEKSNEEARSKKGSGAGSSQDRTRTSITLSLHKKLRDLMGAFQDLRGKFQAEYKEVVERRYFAVYGKKADEQEIEQMIESGESEQIWQKAIREQGRGQVLDTVREIQERHSAVKDLERQLLGLHQIFLDMAVLVEAQGEMLDNIETQVAKANEYVNQGNKALTSAKALQKDTRKWMCCAVMILLSICLIVVLAVVKPWQNGIA